MLAPAKHGRDRTTSEQELPRRSSHSDDGGGGGGKDTPLLGDDQTNYHTAGEHDAENPPLAEEALADVQAAIDEFKGQEDLGSCFSVSPVRNVAEYAVIGCFFITGLALSITGILIESQALQWAGAACIIPTAICAFILARHKQQMIPRLDNHRRLGTLLDMILGSYKTLQKIATSLQTSVDRLTDIETSLGSKVDRLEDLNRGLNALTDTLQASIREGGESLTDLIKQAKTGQDEFWEKCLQLGEVSRQLEETSRKLGALEEKLTRLVDDVLDYPEMQDFHGRIAALKPQFPSILAVAGQTHITEEQAARLKGFIQEIEAALDALSAQDEQAIRKLKDTHSGLQECLSTHCSPASR